MTKIILWLDHDWINGDRVNWVHGIDGIHRVYRLDWIRDYWVYRVRNDGIRIDGLRVDRLGVNGLGVNGLRVDGLRVNGLRVDGLRIDGLRVDRFGIDRIRSDWLFRLWIRDDNRLRFGWEYIGRIGSNNCRTVTLIKRNI